MMRIRTVKPELLLHDKLFDLEKESEVPCRLGYIGLFMASDREGRFKWEPRRLGASILPYDGIDYGRVLDALLSRGFVVKYRVKDQWYGWIPTFKDHQQINNRESDSVLPEVESADEVINACSARGPRVPDASQGEGKGTEQNRIEGNGTLSCAEPPKAAASTPVDDSPVIFTFPIVGKGPKEWHFRESLRVELAGYFPGVDIVEQVRGALAWVNANMGRRKTSTGMKKFLTGWISRYVNSRGTRGEKPANAVPQIRMVKNHKAEHPLADLLGPNLDGKVPY